VDLPMPEPRTSLLPAGWEARIWSILRVLAPIVVVLGVLGIVVGLVGGQSVGLVAVDAMIAVVGGILMLVLRWR
jgi:hypothetical protein